MAIPNPLLSKRHIVAALVCIILFGTASAQANMIRDTEIESGLETIILPLSRAAGYADYDIKIRVVLDESYNAYVIGTRAIYVHSGLILKAKSANEFLGVMAHEIAHIKAGHVQRMGEEVTNANSASALAALAAIAVAASGNGEAATGVIIGGTDRARRNLISSVRRNEAVADEIGLQLLDATKTPATGIRDLMQRMARQHALPESRQSEYYSTHPGAAQRLLTYQDHMNNSPYSSYGTPPTVDDIFTRIETKLDAWTEQPQRILAKTDPEVKPIYQRYAHSIAAYRRGNLDHALELIDAIIAERPGDAYFHEFRGDILISMQRANDSAAAYETAVSIRPQSPQILLNLGRALIASGDPSLLPRAIEAIEQARFFEPSWAFIHRQLGIAYGRAGKLNAADISLADEALLLGDKTRAVQLAKRAIERGGIADQLLARANDIVFSYEAE
ncbi:M48 family metalloprotease [Alphaproteobacteria bacterium]|nr:M48 family metalloprotease [Alphaproteobacteria bacterium]